VPDFADIAPSLRGMGATVGLAQTALGSPGGTITVDVGGQLVTVQVARNITSLAAGDLVSLVRHGSTWYATAQLGTAAVDLLTYSTDAAPSVRPDYVTGQYVLRPTDTGTYRATVGWRDDTTDLYQGQQSGTGRLTGAAFFGSAPTALQGATVTQAVLKLKRLPAGPWVAAAATVKAVTEADRPAGAPTLTGSLAAPALVPDQEADLDIGTTWGQGLVDGTYGGLAIDVAADTPYLRLAGRDSWAAGMAVVIDWRRDG
jgi:hypothetical protein